MIARCTWLSFALLSVLLLAGAGVAAETKHTTYSLQALAFAPNAGGQQAYALRRATDKSEWALFANTYLQTGGGPLLGGGYDLRMPVCDQSCFWQFYAQIGGGLSTVGPYVEVLWGTNLFWIMRLDIATHFYVTASRAIFWSYPLWAGLSLPL